MLAAASTICQTPYGDQTNWFEMYFIGADKISIELITLLRKNLAFFYLDYKSRTEKFDKKTYKRKNAKI